MVFFFYVVIGKVCGLRLVCVYIENVMYLVVFCIILGGIVGSFFFVGFFNMVRFIFKYYLVLLLIVVCFFVGGRKKMGKCDDLIV